MSVAQGRLRYLDVEWIRKDGKRVVVEVDGRGHMEQETWEDDSLRANGVVIRDDAMVLRIPSTIIRTREHVVVAQLRLALTVPRTDRTVRRSTRVGRSSV